VELGRRDRLESRRVKVLRALLALVLLAPACGGDTVSTTATSVDWDAIRQRTEVDLEKLQGVPETMRGSILSWYNGTGLAQLDPTVWQQRLDRACAQKFWINPDRLLAMAGEFAAADQVLSNRDEAAGPVEVPAAASTLWVMALNHCRELVPLEAVRAGPPGFKPEGDS